jgi:hypothetical protein
VQGVTTGTGVECPTAGKGVKVPRTLTGAQGNSRVGVISGYVFRLVRECVALTQERFAEQLGVSVDAVAGWESGRRPLTALPVGQVVGMRHRFLSLGAPPDLMAALDRAIDADVLLTGVLHAGGKADRNPLGSWVMQRDLVEMLAWPITQIPPEALHTGPKHRRRGPVPVGPLLSADQRGRFFDNLRQTVETSRGPGDFLQQRQALYLSGYDGGTRDWVDAQQRHQRPDTWLMRWLTARSIASVATRWGDRERLDHFVETIADDDLGEAANLAYWAYWVGEMRPELSDDFMASGTLGTWEGRVLLDHLLRRLTPDHEYLVLYVHTLWALLAVRPGLLRLQGRSAMLGDRLEAVLNLAGTTGAHAPRSRRDPVRDAAR